MNKSFWTSNTMIALSFILLMVVTLGVSYYAVQTRKSADIRSKAADFKEKVMRVNIQVSASSDDAEQKGDTQQVELNDNDIDMHKRTHFAGFRFTNISLPQGAIIESATMQLNVKDDERDDADHSIYGQKDDNPGTFIAVGSDITDRLRTTESVQWTRGDLLEDKNDEEDNKWINTPELKTIVSEIIRMPSWRAGNAMAMLFYPRSNPDLEIYSYDRNPFLAAKLDIVYSYSEATPTSSPTPVATFTPTPTSVSSPTVTPPDSTGGLPISEECFLPNLCLIIDPQGRYEFIPDSCPQGMSSVDGQCPPAYVTGLERVCCPSVVQEPEEGQPTSTPSVTPGSCNTAEDCSLIMVYDPCHETACENNQCVSAQKPDGSECISSEGGKGTCSGGSCVDDTTCTRKSEGDANCDGNIDGEDYSIWLNGQCHPAGPGQTCGNLQADYNGDGNVDDADYLIWFNNSR